MNIDDESVTTLEDLRGDLAQRHKRTPSSGSSVDTALGYGIQEVGPRYRQRRLA